MTSAQKITSAAVASAAPTDLDDLLGASHSRHWWQRPVLWLGVALLLGGAGGYVYWQQQQSAHTAPRFITEAVGRGNLALTVAAIVSVFATAQDGLMPNDNPTWLIGARK